jgi:hypothetical protein
MTVIRNFLLLIAFTLSAAALAAENEGSSPADTSAQTSTGDADDC